MIWEDAVAFALGLPGAELSTYYGAPAVKAANGRAFLTPGHEAGSFCIQLDLDTVAMLIETDPGTYWQSPHYQGWPAVLVRHDSADPERVRAMIGRAHDWALSRPRPRPRKTP
ncbi:hypothetical protein SAMN06295912_10614 [Sphingomonas laterariae]|uniref:YjbR protein n=1 Tax=Edaphosphingomonas laterariae TaxID=861865 RepID=A0A239E8X2_9SPHN|nr:MmcQ/YjbR family DNA-binding protein [Sphingomonas laterariae]SNS40939.1 hypothetical protein SAMN06295912_10614 [Sphingomonas laterariae]